MSKKLTPLSPVSKDLIYMKVADAIHNYIHVNKLQPGDKIPSERVLAEQLKASRNSVREALRVLENEGLIRVETGKGAFVSDHSSPDPIYFKLFKGNYFELLEIKAIFDHEVIRKLIEKITSAQLKELDEILSLVEAKAAENIYDEENDQRFHRKMLHINGNASMEKMVSNLIDVLSSYATQVNHADDFFLKTIPYHRFMLDGIHEKNYEKAVAAYDKIFEIDLTALETIANEKQ